MDGEVNVTNLSFVEALFEEYLRDPDGIDPAWKAYFEANEPSRTQGLRPSLNAQSIFRGMASAAPSAVPAPKGTRNFGKHTPNPAHIAILRGLSFFTGFSEATISFISSMTEECHVASDEYLLRRGDVGDGVPAWPDCLKFR